MKLFLSTNLCDTVSQKVALIFIVTTLSLSHRWRTWIHEVARFQLHMLWNLSGVNCSLVVLYL